MIGHGRRRVLRRHILVLVVTRSELLLIKTHQIIHNLTIFCVNIFKLPMKCRRRGGQFCFPRAHSQSVVHSAAVAVVRQWHSRPPTETVAWAA